MFENSEQLFRSGTPLLADNSIVGAYLGNCLSRFSNNPEIQVLPQPGLMIGKLKFLGKTPASVLGPHLVNQAGSMKTEDARLLLKNPGYWSQVDELLQSEGSDYQTWSGVQIDSHLSMKVERVRYIKPVPYVSALEFRPQELVDNVLEVRRLENGQLVSRETGAYWFYQRRRFDTFNENYRWRTPLVFEKYCQWTERVSGCEAVPEGFRVSASCE